VGKGLGGVGGVLLALAVPAPAIAQTAAEPSATPTLPTAAFEAPAAEPAGPGNAPNAPPPSTETARALYDAAFVALAKGHRSEAIRLLTRLRERHTEDPLASQAGALLPVLQEPLEPRPVPPPKPAKKESGSQQKTSSARAELVFFQTVHGIGLGAEACLIFDCKDTRPYVLLMMMGAGAGLGLSLSASSDGVTPGLARSLTSGTEWGLWNGVMLGLATDAYSGTSNDGRAIAEGLALGQLTGLAAGGLLYATLEPTAGQVSLASSGGIWTTTAFGLALLAGGGEDASGRAVAGMLLAASDLGLLAGGYLASRWPMSAGRVLLLDAGGLLGVLGGTGTGILIGGDQANGQVVAGLGLAGTLLGLGLATYLTRNWDSEESATAPQLSLRVVPLQHGALGTATVAF